MAVIVLRVVLGGIFIYAGYVKLAEPWQLFAAGIADYEVEIGRASCRERV